MSVHAAKTEHEVAYQDLCALVNRHSAAMTPLEILAVASNLVGKLIALQDQRTTTPEMAMKVVSRNIECGNQQVLSQLAATKGSA